MKLPSLPFKLPDMPDHVLRSLFVIGGALVLFLVLFFTLGSARDSAVNENAQVTNEAAQVKANLTQAKEDRDFVLKNKERYDALLSGDRLIPHTRLTAVRHIQEVALQRGLTDLKYDFTAAGNASLLAASNQPTAGDYHVNVETIKLDVGAPVDGKIYGFLADIAGSFPGAAVIQEVDLSRAAQVTSAMLDAVSRNEDAGLVKGQVILLWRTAQANENKAEPGKK